MYRDLKEVTPEALAKVKLNFQWVADALPKFLRPARPGRVVVVMGSKSDLEFCDEIAKHLKQFAVKHELRIVSAHKAPQVWQTGMANMWFKYIVFSRVHHRGLY